MNIEFIDTLKHRFSNNLHRNLGLDFAPIEKKLLNSNPALEALYLMEITGGEPDVVKYDNVNNEFLFFDCSQQSPINRRSFCYDNDALEARKMHKPLNSAVNHAKELKINLLDEEDYKYLQTLGEFDTKTSSWLKTPDNIRKKGGAIFGDLRFGRVFIYHNGAESYYAARGYRASLKI